jgi:hypothetical protein
VINFFLGVLFTCTLLKLNSWRKVRRAKHQPLMLVSFPTQQLRTPIVLPYKHRR